MKLGIMQPYFFPYLGYFELINRTDRWIVFDTAQYIRHGWVNRNRILHPNEGWQYILTPLQKHSRETTIREIQTAPVAEWRSRVLGQLMHYKKRAPFYRETFGLVERALSYEDTSLSALNTRALGFVCERIGIPWRHSVFSEMVLPLGPVEGPGDWALRISEAVGAKEYINPIGGEALFEPARFEALGIKLTIQPPFEFHYECPGYKFEPGLSVIDALMWNEPARIKAHLDARCASTPTA